MAWLRKSYTIYRCSVKCKSFLVVAPVGFEPTTSTFARSALYPLSYGADQFKLYSQVTPKQYHKNAKVENKRKTPP